MKRKITVFKVSSDRIFEAVCILMFVTSLFPWFSISDVISSYYGFQIVFVPRSLSVPGQERAQTYPYCSCRSILFRYLRHSRPVVPLFQKI